MHQRHGGGARAVPLSFLLLGAAACGGGTTGGPAATGPDPTPPAAPPVVHVGPPPCAGAAACVERCDAGDARACWSASELYLHDLLPGAHERTRETALELLEKGCAAGDAWQCGLVAMHYYFGDSRELYFHVRREGPAHSHAQYEERFPKIHSLGKASCDAGFGIGCEMLARSETYPDPDAAVPRFEQARERYARECDQGEPLSCLALASSYVHGFPVRMSEDGQRFDELMLEARGLYDAACEAGDPAACQHAADLWSWPGSDDLPTDDARVAAALRRSCELLPETRGCDAYRTP